MRRLSVILGIPVDDVTLEEAVAQVEAFARQGACTRQVTTVNTDFVANALADPELLEILRGADLSTADGMPVVWASRLLGSGVRERVTGADLVPALARRCAETGLSLFLLGAKPAVAQTAAERLQDWFPGLRIAGVYSPPMAALEEMDHAGILERIRVARPDILLVAFGSPKQEKWIHRHRDTLGVPVAIGVGGSLDFIAGTTRRAPAWMQRTGLEWSWRLANEPGRLWRRYLADFTRVGPPILHTWILTRPGAWRHPGSSCVTLAERQGAPSLAVRGRLDHRQCAAFASLVEQALRQGTGVTVDLSGCTYVDPAGLGCLLLLALRVQESGARVRLAAVPPHILRQLRLARLDKCLNMEGLS